MEYLGVGALVFLLVLLPLLLAIVIVTAIAGGFLRKTNEFRSRQEKSEELPAVVPAMTNAQIQQSLNQLNDRVQVVEQSVSQIQLSINRSTDLLMERDARGSVSDYLADWSNKAIVRRIHWSTAVLDFESSMDKGLRELFDQPGDIYSKPLEVKEKSRGKGTPSIARYRKAVLQH